ncbi:hypothetical protein CKO25_16360 [Thiocapsa imhoffii]|uniref:Uncharacterized protein n=1 Tax=Thiocapsa imhoffii TaxID=382777 RepID=A0A9X1B9Q5_9GAMM|nr:hypothetical protein [Thiocapsa imhoffii]
MRETTLPTEVCSERFYETDAIHAVDLCIGGTVLARLSDPADGPTASDPLPRSHIERSLRP